MILDLQHQHGGESIVPFLSNIFIDTSIMKIFIDGYVNTQFSKKVDRDYDDLNKILDLLKLSNKWEKFWITPHVLTEICRHLHCDHNKRPDYIKIVGGIMPILTYLKEEKNITKDKILNLINLKKPVIEIGDISLFVSIDSLANQSKKVSVLVKDFEFNKRYENSLNVLIIDFERTRLNLI